MWKMEGKVKNLGRPGYNTVTGDDLWLAFWYTRPGQSLKVEKNKAGETVQQKSVGGAKVCYHESVCEARRCTRAVGIEQCERHSSSV